MHTLRPELDETEKYLKEFIEQDIGVNEQYLRLNALLIMIAFIFACNATVLLFFYFLGDESITYVVQSKSVETVTKGEYREVCNNITFQSLKIKFKKLLGLLSRKGRQC